MNQKSKSILATVLTGIVPFLLQAQQSVQNLPGGLQFRSPPRWETKIAGEAAVLSPPDAQLMPDKSPAELYIVGMLPGVTSLQDPRLIALLEGKYLPGGRGRVLGAPKQFQTQSGTGALHTYEFQQQGVTGRMEIYAVEFPQRGVAAVIAAGTPNLLAARSTFVSAVAASLSLPPAGVESGVGESAAIRQWDRHLRGKKMVQMSSYSSGSSGGSNSRRTLALAADGTFTYQSSSSVSIYVDGANGGSSGQRSDSGRWRLYEQSGKVMLERTNSKGEVTAGVLTMDGTKTLLNNVRWFVVGMNE